MNWEYFFNQQANYARNGGYSGRYSANGPRPQHKITFTIDGYPNQRYTLLMDDDHIQQFINISVEQDQAAERRRRAREAENQQAWEHLRRSFEEVKARMDDARSSMNGLRGWDRIVQLAEVTEEEKVTLTKKQIWNRARRKCHPDTGGSHELWLELIKLESYSRS